METEAAGAIGCSWRQSSSGTMQRAHIVIDFFNNINKNIMMKSVFYYCPIEFLEVLGIYWELSVFFSLSELGRLEICMLKYCPVASVWGTAVVIKQGLT